MFETEIDQIWLSKGQINQYTRIGSPVQTPVDSESRNLDPNAKWLFK